MIKYRFSYSKKGRLRFLSHLELTGTLIKAIRRSGLPYKLTEGFNPHPKIVFSQALPVGFSSREEWAELTLKDEIKKEIFKELLNEHLPEEITIDTCFVILSKRRKLSKDLQIARYRVYFNQDSSKDKIKFWVEGLMNMNCLEIRKKDKMKLIEPRKAILKFELKDFNKSFYLDIYLRADIDNPLWPSDIGHLIISDKKLSPKRVKIEKIEHFLEFSGNLIKVKDFFKHNLI